MHGYAHSEEAMKHAKDADEFVADGTKSLGLAIVDFVYDEKPKTAPPCGRKRSWSNWCRRSVKVYQQWSK